MGQGVPERIGRNSGTLRESLQVSQVVRHWLSDPFVCLTQPPCGRRCHAWRDFTGHGERMSVAVIEVRRAVLVVLLSHDSRTVLLERPSAGSSAWLPLRVDAPSCQPFAAVVDCWQQDHCGGVGMRQAPVTGRLTTLKGSVLSDVYVAILKLSHPEPSDRFSSSARWWAVADLDSAQTFPVELGTLMLGYVEGWIPDGPITLDA